MGSQATNSGVGVHRRSEGVQSTQHPAAVAHELTLRVAELNEYHDRGQTEPLTNKCGSYGHQL